MYTLAAALTLLTTGQEIDFGHLPKRSADYRLEVVVWSPAAAKPKVYRVAVEGNTDREIVRDIVSVVVARHCSMLCGGKYQIITLTPGVRVEFRSPDLPPNLLPIVKDRIRAKPAKP